MKTLLTICARGGSKGIPGKNVRLVAGKPLIHYTIAAATAYARQHPETIIALSTDSEEIRNVAARAGLQTSYDRPARLATDTAGKIAVLADILAYEEARQGERFDLVLDLDVTSPLRNTADINACVNALLSHREALNLLSVSHPQRNPYFNMVEEKASGFYEVVCKTAGPILSRQKAPKVYSINGSIYVYKRAFFTAGLTSATTDRTLVHLIEHLCFDLDEELDLLFMEFLIDNDRLNFPFPD